MGTNTDEDIELDLKEILYLIREKIWLIVLMTVLGGLIAGFISSFLIKPIYTSSAMLYIRNQSTTLTSLSDLQIGSQLTKDYEVLVTSRPVTEKVIENLELSMSYQELLSHVTIGNPSDTRILTISVENTNPLLAKKIVDAFADVASEQIAEIMDMTPPKLVVDGEIAEKPTSPNVALNTLAGSLLGGAATAFFVVLLYIWDDNIKSSDDIEKYLGLNTLGLIPDEEGKKKKNKNQKKRTKK